MRLLGDRLFALIVLILVVVGFAAFFSASLGLLARSDVSITHIALTQLALGLVPGLAALVILRFVPPQWIAKASLPLYLAAIAFTLLVFVPHIGANLNGAARWLNLGFTTVQPAEFLKYATVLMLAGYLAFARARLHSFRSGLIPFCGIVGIPVIILILQPNTSTAIILALASGAMYFLAGAPWRDFGILAAIIIIGAVVLVFARPYLMLRVETFLHPSHDSYASGYQIQQSLIAIGSGGTLGRGFGQSVEKFNYLPEATGDSVFAVYGEEFGFFGAAFLILLFVAFAARGLRIAAESATAAGALAAAGFTLVITLSAFLNIGAMLGMLPLTGLPLPFVSHGGTALFAALAAVGVILNVAAHKKSR